MKKHENEERNANGLTRRELLRTTAFVGGTTALASQVPWMISKVIADDDERATQIGLYELAKPENILYSTCLQCHVDCQIKAKIWDGTLAKLTGSPYSPQNYLPHIPFETSPIDAATIDGKLCAKGQSAIQTYYDPYRIRKVLKRQGSRGVGKGKATPFE